MNSRFSYLRLLTSVLILWYAIIPVYSSQVPQLDYNAVWNTCVPHINSPIFGNRGWELESLTPEPTTIFSGLPYYLTPIITPTTTLPEAEEHIAVYPDNASVLIAVVSDFARGFNFTKYAFSNNGGSTWIDRYASYNGITGLLVTGDGRSWQANSDPVVAIDNVGNCYMSNLYLNDADSANGLYVSRGLLTTSSITHVVSFSNFSIKRTLPVMVNTDPNTTLAEDKPWIAVDNSIPGVAGNVYVSWSHFTSQSNCIAFSRSTDQAGTWSRPLRINPSIQNGAVQGSQVAVGPDGAVYVVYEVFFTQGQRQQWIAKSTDGGLTFGTPVAVTPLFNELSFTSTYRTNSFPALTVTRSNIVCIAYADQPNSTVGAEVESTNSTTPGSMTFTAPQVINNLSTGQQFMPALTSDAAGNVHMSWFDTRHSAAGSSMYDIYATFRWNGLVQWAPNRRVTSSLINAGDATFIGDYAGIAALGGYAHPVWTGGGFNSGRLQTDRLILP